MRRSTRTLGSTPIALKAAPHDIGAQRSVSARAFS
jgi:hypothetical protein